MASTNQGILAALVVTAGCTGNTSGNTSRSCADLTVTEPHGVATGSVFTVVMENHSRRQIFGSPDAPYINSLAKLGAVANGYHDPFVHPSEPNYFWMVAGENFGILDDDDPGSHHLDSTSHLADQLELAGLSWKSYQESMGAPCGLHSHGHYAAKHNPFVYFDDINGWDGKQYNPDPRCNEHVVDYSQLDADIAAGALPRYAFITPNLIDDMHDGSIREGDAWLSRELPKIMATDAYRNGGAIFLLWDEGKSGTFGGAADDPPFLVISPLAKPGFVSTVDYDTSSFLATVQTMFGLDPVPCAEDPAAVAPMDDLFTAPLARSPSP